MKHVSFSSILLFPLVVYFIMQYRISPGDTPYLLFAVIFLALLAYIALDLFTFQQKLYAICKNILLGSIICIVLGSAFISSMIVRHQTSPEYGAHDIILQQEAAIRYFLHGENPYKETYFGTPMEKWHYSDTETNPALYHFVMEPFYLIFPLPFYVASNHLIGYFDAREVLWILFGFLLIIAWFVPKDQEQKRTLVTLLAFNPAMLGYTLEGRSDIFALAFLVFGLFLLQKKKLFWAGLPIALSFAVKQSTWPFIPFYFIYIMYYAIQEQKQVRQRIWEIAKNVSSFFITAGICILPFYFWDNTSFLASTVYYLSGNVAHSYPISGYGFSALMHQIGFIKDVHMYYPFQFVQLLFGIPMLLLLGMYIWKKPSVQKLIICYSFFLFVFWYFSRYFNNSHIGYISMLFIIAYFWNSEITHKSE